MITIAFEDKIPNYYVILVIVILSLIILYRFERSLGLTWMAVKRSGVLSESIGIGVFNHKLIAFVIGCFFSGIAGALFAHYMGIIETSETGKFGALASIYTIIYMVVGGEASFAGPILGAGILTIMPELFRPLKEYQPIIFGVLVIFIMFFMRQGLISFPYHLRLGWIRVGEFLRKFGLEKV
jgi:branched-chain amino acid transport system permease protein